MRRLYVATTPTADPDAVEAIRESLEAAFELPLAALDLPEGISVPAAPDGGTRE